MDHQQRVGLYKQYMAGEGARMDAAAPPLWELLWARGIALPPPPFLGVLPMALISAASLATIPLMLWLLGHFGARRHQVPWSFAVWLVAAAALLGLVGAPIYYRRMARQYGLVSWPTFRGVRQGG